MSFKYSCFISYPRLQSNVMERFVSEFTSSLSGQLELYLDLPVFVDKDHMEPGSHFTKTMTVAICESICLIPILTPVYFSSKSCLREYLAMEKLEKERLALLPKKVRSGLIIPVVLRGARALPEKVTMKRQYFDFSTFSLADVGIDNQPASSVIVQEIAEYIFNLHRAFADLPQDVSKNCSKFKLPEESEVERWMESISPPRLSPYFR